MNQSLKECPVCSAALSVSRYSCRNCHTEISGEFGLSGGQWQLNEELIDFIRIFIYAEGSIKQSEKLLNCSYPKIKNLLKKTKVALGIAGQEVQESDSVLNRLDKGEIDVEEALKQLRTND